MATPLRHHSLEEWPVVAAATLLDGDGAVVESMGEQSSHDCRALVLKVMAAWASVVLTDPVPSLHQRRLLHQHRRRYHRLLRHHRPRSGCASVRRAGSSSARAPPQRRSSR
jgi:hypothetical protein